MSKPVIQRGHLPVDAGRVRGHQPLATEPDRALTDDCHWRLICGRRRGMFLRAKYQDSDSEDGLNDCTDVDVYTTRSEIRRIIAGTECHQKQPTFNLHTTSDPLSVI